MGIAWDVSQLKDKSLNCILEKEVSQYLHWLSSYKPLKSCTNTYDALCTNVNHTITQVSGMNS